MWQRLTRVVRSFFGFFISVAEDPEIILAAEHSRHERSGAADE